jgi:AcrR family transcriptional regulator
MTSQSVIEEMIPVRARHSMRFEAHGLPGGGQKQKSRRERKILAAAFEEFAKNGYAAARLDNVAKRANVAKGTIYLYFKSKNCLFRAVVQSLIHPRSEGFASSLYNFSGSASELLQELISRQYAQVVMNRKARAVLRLLIAESGKFPQLSDIYLREVIEPGVAAMRLVIEKGVASGEFRETKMAAFPQILAAPAVMAVVWILVLGHQAPLNLDAYRAAHLELVHSGLRKDSHFEVPVLEEVARSGERS